MVRVAVLALPLRIWLGRGHASTVTNKILRHQHKGYKTEIYELQQENLHTLRSQRLILLANPKPQGHGANHSSFRREQSPGAP